MGCGILQKKNHRFMTYRNGMTNKQNGLVSNWVELVLSSIASLEKEMELSDQANVNIETLVAQELPSSKVEREFQVGIYNVISELEKTKKETGMTYKELSDYTSTMFDNFKKKGVPIVRGMKQLSP